MKVIFTTAFSSVSNKPSFKFVLQIITVHSSSTGATWSYLLGFACFEEAFFAPIARSGLLDYISQGGKTTPLSHHASICSIKAELNNHFPKISAHQPASSQFIWSASKLQTELRNTGFLGKREKIRGKWVVCYSGGFAYSNKHSFAFGELYIRG